MRDERTQKANQTRAIDSDVLDKKGNSAFGKQISSLQPNMGDIIKEMQNRQKLLVSESPEMTSVASETIRRSRSRSRSPAAGQQEQRETNTAAVAESTGSQSRTPTRRSPTRPSWARPNETVSNSDITSPTKASPVRLVSPRS